MAGVIKIRSKKGPRRMCGKVIGSKYQSVDLDAYIAYKKTRMGAIVIKDCIEELKGNKNSKALNNAEVQSLKEQRTTDKKRIKGLEDEIASLKAKILELEEQLEGYSSSEETEVDEPVKEDPTTEADKPFEFDPEIHTIDHRGGGSYFVMDQNDEKVYGPLSDEEKTTFSAMLKD